LLRMWPVRKNPRHHAAGGGATLVRPCDEP
jgi:hypothetical protein